MAESVRIVVMGVSGSGKSTIGTALAAALGAAFVDADDLHPAANIEKMAAGIALDDADRLPWLQSVAELLENSSEGLVVACSALRRQYRDLLAKPSVFFVHLEGDRDLLLQRLARRETHFMPSSLLDSQLATLEPLDPDERGITVSIDQSLSRIVSTAANSVASPVNEGSDP